MDTIISTSTPFKVFACIRGYQEFRSPNGAPLEVVEMAVFPPHMTHMDQSVDDSEIKFVWLLDEYQCWAYSQSLNKETARHLLDSLEGETLNLKTPVTIVLSNLRTSTLQVLAPEQGPPFLFMNIGLGKSIEDSAALENLNETSRIAYRLDCIARLFLFEIESACCRALELSTQDREELWQRARDTQDGMIGELKGLENLSNGVDLSAALKSIRESIKPSHGSAFSKSSGSVFSCYVPPPEDIKLDYRDAASNDDSSALSYSFLSREPFPKRPKCSSWGWW